MTANAPSTTSIAAVHVVPANVQSPKTKEKMMAAVDGAYRLLTRRQPGSSPSSATAPVAAPKKKKSYMTKLSLACTRV